MMLRKLYMWTNFEFFFCGLKTSQHKDQNHQGDRSGLKI